LISFYLSFDPFFPYFYVEFQWQKVKLTSVGSYYTYRCVPLIFKNLHDENDKFTSFDKKERRWRYFQGKEKKDGVLRARRARLKSPKSAQSYRNLQFLVIVHG